MGLTPMTGILPSVPCLTEPEGTHAFGEYELPETPIEPCL